MKAQTSTIPHFPSINFYIKVFNHCNTPNYRNKHLIYRKETPKPFMLIKTLNQLVNNRLHWGTGKTPVPGAPGHALIVRFLAGGCLSSCIVCLATLFPPHQHPSAPSLAKPQPRSLAREPRPGWSCSASPISGSQHPSRGDGSDPTEGKRHLWLINPAGFIRCPVF